MPPQEASAGLCLKLARQGRDQLSDPGLLHRQTQPDQPPGRRFGPEDGRRAERPDHFVVAHVNDPKVALMARALAGDGENDVRVDGGDGHVDNLEVFVGVSFAQEHFQITSRAVSGFRISLRGGFSQNEDAVSVGGLAGLH